MSSIYYDKLCDLGIKLTRRSGSEKVSCPKCYDGRKNKNKRDLSVNIDTGSFCCHNDGCGFKGNVRTQERSEKKVFKKPDEEYQQSFREKILQQRAELYLTEERKISKKTLKRYMIYSQEKFFPQTNKKENAIAFPFIRKKNSVDLVNVKFRSAKKDFCMISEAELILFGLQFLDNKTHVILTEGEIDALTAADCGFGVDGAYPEDSPEYKKSIWCPLSVPNGASDKGTMQLEYLDNCFDELSPIHEFIIATDGDSAGEKLREELVRRLGIERCRIVEYPKDSVVPIDDDLFRPCKDLNEVKKYIGPEAVENILLNAKFLPIEGVYYLEDLYPRMFERFKKGILMGESTRMGPEFDALFRWKRGDVNLGTGYANAGKTNFENQLELSKSIYDGWKWGCFCPENYPADDFYDDLVEVFVGKHLAQMSDEEYFFGCEFIMRHFFYVYPDDEQNLDAIFERFRNLVMKKGIDGGRIDPMNQLDKVFGPYGMTTEERLSVDLKKIKRFAQTNSMCMNLIAHPKNPTYSTDKDGNRKALPVVDVYDLSGGAQYANKCDNIWSYYRPNFHINKEDPSVEVYMQKIKRKRTGGSLGSTLFTLDWATKRYIMADGVAHCDPKIAEKIMRQENFNQGISTSLFDESMDDDEDLPF